MATIRDICEHLENLAPLSTQESYDNSGLLTGNKNSLVKGIICSLDCTEEVIQEAINKGCNLVVCHHPIIFKGLKSLTGKNYVERTIIKAIQNDIAIYAIHTNLDNYLKGVNYKIAELLGIKHPKILSPLSNQLLKLKTYVPLEHIEKVASALFHAGAGNIGNYDECSFSTTGIGTFRANNNATPFVGEKNVRHHEEEKSLEVIVPKALKGKITTALLHAHPYEEVAYDLYPIENPHKTLGAGMIGELPEAMSLEDFLKQLKTTFKTGSIRYTNEGKKNVKKIAWCGGSGHFLLNTAIQQGADCYVTGDIKYHEFFDAEDRINFIDIGHYESEQYTINLLHTLITNKFANFATYLTGINTNPVNYF